MLYRNLIEKIRNKDLIDYIKNEKSVKDKMELYLVNREKDKQK